MLVRYRGQKVGGCPVKIPVGLKSWGLMQKVELPVVNGTELDANPVKPGPKKRGRRSKAQLLAMARAKDAANA